MVRRVWTLSQRLGLGVGVILLILGFIVGLSGYFTISNIFEVNLRERAESQARQLALFGADAILTYDYATLERYVNQLSSEPGIVHIEVRRSDGELLAQTDAMVEYRPSRSYIEVKESLLIGESVMGSVFLAVDRRGTDHTLRQFLVFGFLILASVIVFLFFILSRFMDRSVINPIQRLVQETNPLIDCKYADPKSLPRELGLLAETFQGLCKDVQKHLNDRQLAEELARNATARLSREQRLATVGQIAAGLAHNLNTPLGSIRGYGQLLQERVNDPEHARFASMIVDQAESCASTVKNLLTAVRQPEITLCEFNLYDQVIGAIELMKPLFLDQNIELPLPNSKSDEDIYNVTGDPGAVEQILFNLLVNAIQAGAHSVSVSIGCEDGNSGCSVLIHDDGPGISKDLVDTLFDPFVTDKSPGEGTGIGLYISRQLAERMGASLTLIEDSSGQGTIFELGFMSKPRDLRVTNEI